MSALTVVREPVLRLSTVDHGTEWDCTLCPAGRVRLHFDDALQEWAAHWRAKHEGDE